MRERPDLTDDSVLSSLHVSLILLLLAVHLYHVLTILAFVPLLSSRVMLTACVTFCFFASGNETASGGHCAHAEVFGVISYILRITICELMTVAVI